jgi:aryl-alcohol dehydrogenase-like predicted oxidoreductase
VSQVKVGELEVKRIGLGTNRLTHSQEHVDFIKAAVAEGVQMIDTAHSYTGGQSEETIGEARSLPATVIVATKAGIGGAGRGRPEVLRAEIEESFRRLGSDTITLHYLHRVDPDTPIEESLGAIKEYVDRGRIRHVGISEVRIDQIERAREVVPITAVQNHYNIGERKYEAVVDYCEREGIVFVPFFPLRADGGAPVREIAHKHGVSPSQVLLAWLLRRSPAMLPIPGTLSIAHLKENLSALNVELTEAEFQRLR